MERCRLILTVVFLGLMISANAATTTTDGVSSATTTTTTATMPQTSAAVTPNDTNSNSNDTGSMTTTSSANVTQMSGDMSTGGMSTDSEVSTDTTTTSTSTTASTTTTMSTTTMPPTTTPTTGTTRGAAPTSTMAPCPTSAGAAAQKEESDFGKVGFVAFGITFAIAVILAIILIVMLVQKKRKSGVYMTAEPNTPRREGMPMSMPMNDGGLDHVQTIDLDKGDNERKLGNGTGLSSFTVEKEEQKNTGNTSSFGNTGNTSLGKQEDSGSVNNLLKEEPSDKEVSDDEEGPAAVVGLKVEPSTGASVESLEKLKETDKLMENGDNRSNSPSIDDNLPPPSLSGSESGEV